MIQGRLGPDRRERRELGVGAEGARASGAPRYARNTRGAASALDVPDDALVIVGDSSGQIYRPFLQRIDSHVAGGSRVAKRLGEDVTGRCRVSGPVLTAVRGAHA